MKRVDVRELLTAAVDGELTPAERKAAERVLRESEPARQFYAQLKADAARLKKLARRNAPSDLADNVMATIGERALTPTPLPPSRMPSRKFNWGWLPVWTNIAAAACVLVVISLGSYFYFSLSQQYMAQQNQGMANLPAPRDNDAGATPQAAPMPRERTPEVPRDAVVEKPRSPEIGPLPHEVIPDRITSPPEAMPEIEPFQPDKIRLSQLFKLEDLASDGDARKKLVNEMKKDELIRLDLFCHASPKALEHVVAALKSRGITAVIDNFVNERLKKNLPTELMIFTEALTPDEVAQLMAALGAEEKKSGAGQFDTLVAAPFLSDDLTKLGKLLGMPNVPSKQPKAKGPVDIRKPLPEGTAQHVAATLNGMGTSATPPKPERMAVVVAYSPMNGNPQASKEIKQFLDRRGERKADAKPMMLVLKIISK
ncbi:MAG TPA: hypothetical protein VHR66_14915 [Gemmataceae bacterium]|jgi:negative regulator of sigma E activity|nr:hypothetical protein [Gemmataceae bacterium]